MTTKVQNDIKFYKMTTGNEEHDEEKSKVFGKTRFD